MVITGSGVQNEKGYWVKGAGGHQDGYQLLEDMEAAGATTLPAILQYAAAKHGDALCMGTRLLLGRERIVENNKTLEKLKLGEYTFMTYNEVLDKVRMITAGLGAIGMGDTGRVAMFAETRAEWFMTAIGCLWQKLALVTVYTNLGDESIVSSINETEVSVIVTSHDLLQRTLKLLPRCPKVEKLIVLEDQLDGINMQDIKDVTVIPFSNVTKAGEGKEAPKEMPAGSDLAIIMYTSGSSGRPKGVELTHDNLYWAIKGYTIQADIGLGDRYLAFLPLAHVMELATEIALVALNVSIIYASPHTLTKTSPKVMKGSLGDAQVGRPTCMNAVPLILDRIIKGVSKTVEEQNFIKASIFSSALKWKQKHEDGSNAFVSKVLDTIVFNRVKEQLGGQLRMLVVGGAPLSADTHSKIRALFGCTLQTGYGATETAASITSSDTDDPRSGHCGPPNHGVLLRLRDWPEGGYLTTDTPHPRGEILVGGPTVAKGYFNLPGETAEAFMEEDGVRWFQTGDIGMIDSTGVLQIIDRMKDLIKLNNGEYISLGTIESKLKTHPIVESICVYAYPGAVRCVAIVVPNISEMQNIANTMYMEPRSDEWVSKDEAVKIGVASDLCEHGKKQGLTRWETPMRVHLTLEPWTPESGLVTGSLKNRRIPITNHFKAEIDDMYTRPPPK